VKVLVTGATGFVGGPVVRRLLADGHVVRAAVRRASHIENVEVVAIGDIDAQTRWSTALHGIDVVVHLAARVHVMKESVAGSAMFRSTNTDGTLRLAGSMLDAGARRIVFLSTIKVNGEETLAGRRFTADDEPAPSDPYAVSKRDAETGLFARAGLETVVIRPPLVYGPGVKGNLARLCRLAQLGVPVPFGAIQNRRDLIGVRNLADLVANCVVHPAAQGQVFLASDGVPLSTTELFSKIAAAAGRSPRTLNVPVSMLQQLGRMLGVGAEIGRLTGSLEIDTDKTRQLLDWTPPFSPEADLDEMVRAFHSGLRRD
jgi:nucleoside-diphosphate-sugar epimerase